MITRLRVQGYKSFADAELRLGPLNVIVGPNNVGKSNLFDLLKLLSRFAQVPFRQAFDEREHRGDPVESFRDGGRAVLTVELGFDLRGAPHPFDESKGLRYPGLTYRISVRFDAETRRFSLADEYLDYDPALVEEDQRKRRRNPLVGTVADDGGDRLRVMGDPGRGRPRLFDLRAERSLLTLIDDAELYGSVCAVQRELASWRFYHFEPEALRAASPVMSRLDMDSDGTGLSGVLDTMQQDGEGSASFERVRRELIHALPEVEDLSVVPTGDRRVLLEITQRGGAKFTGRVVSDGVLRFLALLVLAYVPSPGALVCFEEPENGVHPGRLQFLVEHLRNIARDRRRKWPCQVIVNSHSPYLVDYLEPAEMVVARASETGDTRFANVELDLFKTLPKLKQYIESGEATLGELWFRGDFDAVP